MGSIMTFTSMCVIYFDHIHPIRLFSPSHSFPPPSLTYNFRVIIMASHSYVFRASKVLFGVSPQHSPPSCTKVSSFWCHVLHILSWPKVTEVKINTGSSPGTNDSNA